MLENWLFSHLKQEAQQFIFQQDGAPPHWHLSVRDYLNINYPRRWIGRQTACDRHFITGLQEALNLPPAIFSYGEGFQLRLSAELEASDFISLSLPLASKVSRQPYLVAHSGSSVKILRAVLQGDPFLGEDVICNFDEALLRVPGNN
ncbi:hypothetical protein J6590_006980 [Homalodisca vitripennis]|nr:hypothetical protein J6590_006980 [Homalodisca vitripennis]